MKMERSAALVTGAGTRLGRQFALHLAELGYDIALHYNTSADAAKQVSLDIQAKGVDCEIFKLDFYSDFDATEFITGITARFPHLNCLINSASVYDPVSGKDTPRALLEKQFKINLFAPYLLTQGFAKQTRNGQVINIIDNKVVYNQYHYSAYLLSKKAFADFTKMAAVEFAPNTRINGIAPGVILPTSSRTSDYLDWRIEGILVKRKGEPSHLLKALDYLLQNDFVCGQILFVDGGESENIIGRNSENFVVKNEDT